MPDQGSTPWRLLFHPDQFGPRYDELIGEVERLREALLLERFRVHPTAKLLYAVQRIVNEIVPSRPDAPEFHLRGALSRFRRVKHHGLSGRFRLFYVFSLTARTIIYLYLNDETSMWSPPEETGSRRKSGFVYKPISRRSPIDGEPSR